MSDQVTLPVTDRSSEASKSTSSATLYSGVWNSFRNDALRLAGRDSLNVRICTGSEMPVPPVATTAELLDGLDCWIAQHAQQSETFQVPLSTLEKPSRLSQFLDTLWRSVQRFYRFHLKWFSKPAS